ncbi:MAG: hypothetical protein ACLFVP_00230 [Candidatus Bathyarchaeia archaeon]
MDISVELDEAKSYGDIFSLVKRAVKNELGLHRMGLMLYLGNLPMKVGAFHPMGTNDIVLNRRLFNQNRKETKFHIFTTLLHEYLHSLGIKDEREVRSLVYQICRDNFPKGHPIHYSAKSGPWADMDYQDLNDFHLDLDLELVRDFEQIDIGYII